MEGRCSPIHLPGLGKIKKRKYIERERESAIVGQKKERESAINTDEDTLIILTLSVPRNPPC